MAFVSIDNPNGIQHHGGNMAWCRISATRVAMLTFTKDNKALIQELNYVGGDTVIGTPTMLKQITAAAQPYMHMRSFIRVLSADRLFVMLPSTFVNLVSVSASTAQPCLFTGSMAQPTLATTVATPITYTCMTLQRNADGTYTMDSSTNIDMTFTTNASMRDSKCSAIDIDITTSQIIVHQFLRGVTNNMRAGKRATLTLVAGKITAQAITQPSTLGGNTRYSCVMDSREKLTPTGETVRKYMVIDNGTDSLANYIAISQVGTAQILCENAQTIATDASFPTAPWSNTTGYGINTAAWLPIDKTAKTYVYVGGTGYFNNGIQVNTLNDIWVDAGEEIQYPLDAAWVTNSLACIVGQAGRPNTKGNPANGPYMWLAGDMAFAQHPDFYVSANGGYGTVLRQLCLGFRNILSMGVYAGPLDAIRTQYYTCDGKNSGNMIHRIDDTAFWLIGCFRDGIAGEDKLGVITVKA